MEREVFKTLYSLLISSPPHDLDPSVIIVLAGKSACCKPIYPAPQNLRIGQCERTHTAAWSDINPCLLIKGCVGANKAACFHRGGRVG